MKTRKPKITHYKIRWGYEELTCPNCGFPLYIGDMAYELDGEIACSQACLMLLTQDAIEIAI